MTLDTHVHILDPIAVDEVWDFCRSLLGAENARFTEEPSKYHIGTVTRMNTPGQGLPAWLWIDFGADGPIPDKYGEDPKPEPFIDVSFDTGYGYQADNGAGCGDLHAWLVDRLTRWLDERSIAYRWQNEFTGEWFTTRDALADLGDMTRGALRSDEVSA